jgi:hypothetical protein
LRLDRLTACECMRPGGFAQARDRRHLRMK